MGTDTVRVVIADDEQLICTLLKEIIEWDALDLTLTGIAYNGRELLSCILAQRPDIVITDICMPEMDGIELVRQVREKGIPCRFIVVSGYRLFEYAHNALKYNVEDYILKPIDNVELNHRLGELARSVRQERGGFQLETAMGNEGYKRFFLNRVVEDLTETTQSLDLIRSAYGIAFRPGRFQVLCVVLDLPSYQGEMVETGTVMKKLAARLESALQPDCTEVLVDVDGRRIMAGLNYDEAQSEVVRRDISTYFDYARDLVNLFDSARVTIGVGAPFDTPMGLKASKEQAQCAVWARIALGIDRVIEYQPLSRTEPAISGQVHESLFQKIRRSCESWDPQGFREAASSVFVLIRGHFCAAESRTLCYEIVDTFLDACAQIIQAYSNEDYLRRQIVYGLKCATTFEGVERAVLEPILSTMSGLIQEFEKQEAKPIRQALRYMEEHYAKPLRLDDVAAQVFLCPAYFSTLFKKETGDTFTDYLTGLRMAKAKECLQRTDMNIQEIASGVGYPDARYFSKLFCKQVGIKPTEYRKIYG